MNIEKNKIQTLVDRHSKPTYDIIDDNQNFETLVSGDLGFLIDVLTFKANQSTVLGLISRDTENVVNRWTELIIYDDDFFHCFYAYKGQESKVLNSKAEEVGYAILEFDKLTKAITEQFKLANTIKWDDVMDGKKSKSDYWDLLDEAMNYKTGHQRLPLKYLFVKH